MLALSTRDGLPRGKQYVFRLFATYRAEVRALAAAAAGRGLERYAILYPDSGYGRTMRRLMVEELKARGLTVAVEMKYTPSEAAFVEVAKGLAEEDFEALFVPDVASRVALVAPALAAAGPECTLLPRVRTSAEPRAEPPRGTAVDTPSALPGAAAGRPSMRRAT